STALDLFIAWALQKQRKLPAEQRGWRVVNTRCRSAMKSKRSIARRRSLGGRQLAQSLKGGCYEMGHFVLRFVFLTSRASGMWGGWFQHKYRQQRWWLKWRWFTAACWYGTSLCRLQCRCNSRIRR